MMKGTTLALGGDSPGEVSPFAKLSNGNLKALSLTRKLKKET